MYNKWVFSLTRLHNISAMRRPYWVPAEMSKQVFSSLFSVFLFFVLFPSEWL